MLFAVVIALFRVSIFSLRFFLGNESPLAVVEGPSMEQTYYEGEILVVKGVDDKHSIKLQDVIVFHEPNDWDMVIVHRVIEIITINSNVEFITKGDNNPSSDYEYWGWRVRESDIIGVVIGKLPSFAGSIIMAIESQFMTVFTVIIIMLFIGLDYILEKDTREA